MPKVSIIIPTFNHGRALRACLDAVLKQIFTDYEVIIVDDGSTDDTEKLLAARLTPVFTLIKTENHDAAAARNTGFDRSSGKYVIFCDADTILAPPALQRMVDVLDEHPEVAFVYSSFKLGLKTMWALPFNPETLKKFNYIDVVALLRREHFPRFDESLHRFQDWDLWLTVAGRGGRGQAIHEILFVKRQERRRKSYWLPAFIYYLLPFLPVVRRYERARQIVMKKHGIINHLAAEPRGNTLRVL